MKFCASEAMGEVFMAGPLTVLNHYGTADLTEHVDH
jgi:hypothetical protein